MIRMATVDDAPAVAGIYRPYVDGTVISFESVPPTADEMRARISQRGSRTVALAG